MSTIRKKKDRCSTRPRPRWSSRTGNGICGTMRLRGRRTRNRADVYPVMKPVTLSLELVQELFPDLAMSSER